MNHLVKINNRFSFRREGDCWYLYQKSKTKSKKTGRYPVSVTYYGQLKHLCSYVIECSLDKCKSLKEIKDYLNMVWLSLQEADATVVDSLETEVKNSS